MTQKTYLAFRVSDINDEKEIDFKKWEVIFIKAYNYQEAKNKLKDQQPFEDMYLIPRKVLKCRDIIKKSKLMEDINGLSN